MFPRARGRRGMRVRPIANWGYACGNRDRDLLRSVVANLLSSTGPVTSGPVYEYSPSLYLSLTLSAS